MTVLQANRYKEIIDKRGAQGELFGLDSEFVKHIFELFMRSRYVNRWK